jgi:hypothetical protein
MHSCLSGVFNGARVFGTGLGIGDWRFFGLKLVRLGRLVPLSETTFVGVGPFMRYCSAWGKLSFSDFGKLLVGVLKTKSTDNHSYSYMF